MGCGVLGFGLVAACSGEAPPDAAEAPAPTVAGDAAVDEPVPVTPPAPIDSPETDAGVPGPPAVDAGAPVSLDEVIDFGTVSPGFGGRVVVDFSLPDVEAFQVNIVGTERDLLLGVIALTGPEGNLADFQRIETSPIRVLPNPGATSVLVPNHPGVKAVAGDYRLEVVSLRSDGLVVGQPLEVSVRYRPVERSGARIDVNLHFTGVEGPTAASAQTDRRFQAALAGFKDIYAAAGVEIGEVRYRDIDPRFAEVPFARGAVPLVREMVRLSDAPGLNFFFIDRFVEGGAALGVSAGLPGPAHRPGSTASGVVVAQGSITRIQTLSHVMAHEGAHWLGLFHTSELGMLLHDQMPDTPEIRWVQGQANVGPEEVSYLMFPAATGFGGARISPEQARVMRRHFEGLGLD